MYNSGFHKGVCFTREKQKIKGLLAPYFFDFFPFLLNSLIVNVITITNTIKSPNMTRNAAPVVSTTTVVIIANTPNVNNNSNVNTIIITSLNSGLFFIKEYVNYAKIREKQPLFPQTVPQPNIIPHSHFAMRVINIILIIQIAAAPNIRKNVTTHTTNIATITPNIQSSNCPIARIILSPSFTNHYSIKEYVFDAY